MSKARTKITESVAGPFVSSLGIQDRFQRAFGQDGFQIALELPGFRLRSN